MAELMAVVAIVGILAALATVSVKKYVASSKTSEAVHMIASIKIAQETYKDETFAYLNVSHSLTAFFPANNKPGQQKMNFAGTDALAADWQKLGVLSDAPVLFVYATTAGPAGATPSATGSDITVGNWPTSASTKPWYVVKAVADLDGDGVNTVFITGSFAGELFAAND
jgi:type II secretory pathway pseudopilin PulG